MEITEFKLLFTGDASSAVQASTAFAGSAKSAGLAASLLTDTITELGQNVTALAKPLQDSLAIFDNLIDRYALVLNAAQQWLLELQAETDALVQLSAGVENYNETLGSLLPAVSSATLAAKQQNEAYAAQTATVNGLTSSQSALVTRLNMVQQAYSRLSSAAKGASLAQNGGHGKLPGASHGRTESVPKTAKAHEAIGPTGARHKGSPGTDTSHDPHIFHSASPSLAVRIPGHSAGHATPRSLATDPMTPTLRSVDVAEPKPVSDQPISIAENPSKKDDDLNAQAVQEAQNAVDKLTKSWQDYEREILTQQGRGSAAIDKIISLEELAKATQATKDATEAAKAAKQQLSDQLASTVVSGLKQLTEKTAPNESLYHARVGLDQSLSNLDTAYAGGLQNAGTAAAFAHDRAMIQNHLKQVENAYKENANSISNVVKRTFASLAHAALDDAGQKVETALSKSISNMIQRALTSPSSGGARASQKHVDSLKKWLGGGQIAGAPGQVAASQTVASSAVANATYANATFSNATFPAMPGGGGTTSGGGTQKTDFGALFAANAMKFVPKLASGGDFSEGQPFVAGDPGPNSELILPKNGGHVFTAAETRSILNRGAEGGAGSKQEIHVHIHGQDTATAFAKNPQVIMKRAIKATMAHMASTRTSR